MNQPSLKFNVNAKNILKKRFFKFESAETSSEVFEILWKNGVITKGVSQKMKELVGFRNILAHAYRKIFRGDKKLHQKLNLHSFNVKSVFLIL